MSLKKLCADYNFVPRGILHIGAHQAEELSMYDSLGIKKVVWVEANPKIFKGLTKTISKYPGQKAINALISNVDHKKYNFYITNNGQSSSLLELEKHKIYYPEVRVTNTIVLKSKKIDTLIKEKKLNICDFNFLNLDIQGAELLVLQGFKHNLPYIDYIYTEINSGEVYKNCAKVNEIDDYLKKFGFVRVETVMTDRDWGDGFYIKAYLTKNIKIKKRISKLFFRVYRFLYNLMKRFLGMLRTN